jgi:glyoxylate reductase
MKRPSVYVSRRLPGSALDRIAAECDVEVWQGELPPPRDALLAAVEGREGLLTLLTERVDAELFDRAGDQLRVVSNYAIGVDNVDLAEAKRRGVVVCNTPDVLTETTADLAFTLLLAAARRLSESVDFVRRGEWKTWDPGLLLGHDVHGATLGIVGMGRIGAAVARRAIGFGMRVIYVSRSPAPALDAALGVGAARSLEELLAEADFVSLHAPSTAETRHLIDAAALSQMKRSAILVNTARGPLVDTEALVAALDGGEIACAALDVTDPEPLPAAHPLIGHQRAIVVPHIGSATRSTREGMANLAADNLLQALRGERPRHMVTG